MRTEEIAIIAGLGAEPSPAGAAPAGREVIDVPAGSAAEGAMQVIRARSLNRAFWANSWELKRHAASVLTSARAQGNRVLWAKGEELWAEASRWQHVAVEREREISELQGAFQGLLADKGVVLPADVKAAFEAKAGLPAGVPISRPTSLSGIGVAYEGFGGLGLPILVPVAAAAGLVALAGVAITVKWGRDMMRALTGAESSANYSESYNRRLETVRELYNTQRAAGVPAGEALKAAERAAGPAPAKAGFPWGLALVAGVLLVAGVAASVIVPRVAPRREVVRAG